jgi:hypothetical protein
MRKIPLLLGFEYSCATANNLIFITLHPKKNILFDTKIFTCSILFGNENGTNWKQFGEFIVTTHPSINRAEVTIVTDQDKGQLNAIAQFVKNAGHFHCSWHRRQYIIKKCGGGGGKIPYTALWMYNKLIQCRTTELIDFTKEQHMPKMHNSDLYYLNSLTDTSQYPAARCAMGENIYMYHRTSSAAVESINAANKEICQRTGK